MGRRPVRDDLCSTCRLADECVYGALDRDPVEECEGYVGVESPPLTRLAGRPVRLNASRPRRSESFAGLCVNCSLRFVCTREMPPGGVWHCVDYC